jgi:hypothetical protein
MALLAAWLAGKILSTSKPPWKLVSQLGACIILIFLSEARTAGVAFVLGISIAIIVIPWLSKKPIRFILPSISSRRVHLFIGFVLAGLIIAGPLVNQKVQKYITKRSHAENLAEAYSLSRGRLIHQMLANIEKTWLHGIGFGIASQSEVMVVKRDPYLELPVAASIEKGVLPLAVLEELGVIGFIIVSLWFLMIIRRAVSRGIIPFAVLLTLILMNLGESTLFSPGGMGLLLAILVAWTVNTTPDRIIRN